MILDLCHWFVIYGSISLDSPPVETGPTLKEIMEADSNDLPDHRPVEPTNPVEHDGYQEGNLF